MLAPINPSLNMSGDHPFQQLFETFGKPPAAHSESVNREARETLREKLSVPIESPGHFILLKAPRAGHGKTHLLTKLLHDLGGSHEFIPLHATGGSRIDALTVLEDTLRRLVRPLPAAGGLTVLDLVARRLFSSSLQPLVNSGEVPCQDREGALSALRSRPVETFDFHHPAAVTAHWARENFELLGPRLSLELAQRIGLPLREVSFWVDTMFRFAATPIDNPGRVRALAAHVFDSPSAESAAHERLVALLGLMGSQMRVVLVADELEGFSSDEAAALRFASFLGSLRQSVERAEVILSVNQDVWESAFLPRLSGGLADRLSEVTVELAPLDRRGMLAIIESRSPGMGEKILGSLGEGHPPTYARGIIKGAAENWGGTPKDEAAIQPVEKPQSGFAVSDHAEGIPAPATPEPAPPNLESTPNAFPEPVVAAPAPAFPIAAEAPSSAVAPPQPPVSAPAVENPIEVPTNFSPEAAIAAYQGNSPAVQPLENPFSSSPGADAGAPPANFSAPAQPAFSSEPPHQADPRPESPVEAFQGGPADLPEDAAEKPASTDRVDDLLRQFRERYGKS
ncbi:hypothetical protein HZ994_17925 [Akkermansiaceae bacterium]|nr:hypothetical protein HZ994_17925 [Akkermansiaceae bacterium]